METNELIIKHKYEVFTPTPKYLHIRQEYRGVILETKIPWGKVFDALNFADELEWEEVTK